METKEAIAKKYVPCRCDEIYTSRGLTAPDCPYHANDPESAMDEWAKEIGCLFLEWLPDSGWRIYPIYEGEYQLWYKDSGDINVPDEQMTTSQLYDYFLQSIQQP